MAVSVFDLFKVGIGPSSSHTVGPMRAALMFAHGLERDGLLPQVGSVRVELYGSLGATGKGHGTDKGVILGLMGDAPDTVDPETIEARLATLRAQRKLALLGTHEVPFVEREHIVFYRREAMAEHPNGMKFHAFDADGTPLREARYLSVGGGFVVTAGAPNTQILAAERQLPHPFRSGRAMLEMAHASGMSIARLMLENQLAWRPEQEVMRWPASYLGRDAAMPWRCGIAATDGELPGPFRVRRRAPELYRGLTLHAERALSDPLSVMDWVNLYAIAVNEENAAGGRVVTAPTNGAAGIIPAVLHYYDRFIPGANRAGVVDFLLTAGAIGLLYKLNASISGAGSRLPGEVGVGLLDGRRRAGGGARRHAGAGRERGRDRHGAQPRPDLRPGRRPGPDPCIERNAMASVKAVNAARMALRGDGTHYVSLDSVIKTMRETGADMKTKYKETARGGLAVNIVEC